MPGQGRVGFATARAIGVHARRNRAKRRARAAFNEVGLVDVHWDVVVFVRESALTMDFETMQHELTALLEEARGRWDGRSASH